MATRIVKPGVATTAKPSQRRVSLSLPFMGRGSEWMFRHFWEERRKQGHARELVLKQIRARHDPSPQDLAAALREAPPDPIQVADVPLTPEELQLLFSDPPADFAAWLRAHITDDRRREGIERARKAIADDTATLCEYVAKVYVLGQLRRPGRKHPPRTVAEEARIASDYFAALERARRAREADSRRPRAIAKTVQLRIAAKYHMKRRTLQNIIRGISANIS